MKKSEVTETEVAISKIAMAEMRFFLVGTSPLVPHAMSAKAAGTLIFPAPKKNAAEKATTMKHEPFSEFREAAYSFEDADDTPTRLYMPAGAFHAALADVAIDLVGAKKSQVARLTSVPGQKIPVWGIPQIWTTIVRSSDMNRTPDVRTLPILPRWAAIVDIKFVGSLIKPESIGNLLANAGVIIGIGDGRPQKGKLSMGCWRLCNEDDVEFRAIVKSGGRVAQDKGLADPTFYDRETERLLTWFTAEKERRHAAPAREINKAPTKRSNNGTPAHT